MQQHSEKTSMEAISVLFLPSFLYGSELAITDGVKPAVSLKITKRNEKDSIETVHVKTFDITGEELSMLITAIDSFNQEYSGPQTGFGLDGISVFVVSNRLKANDTIEFWSPSREGSDNVYYQLLDPVFTVMKKYMTADAEMMYVEQLEQYFDYGVPIKKTGNNEFRIYGALSYFEHVTNAINSLIHDIPSGESVVIDMSNFEGMGTIYYPHFKKLLAKNNQIKWIVNERARQQLLEIGWPKTNLEQTTKKNFWELP
jgi:hypothetical protein